MLVSSDGKMRCTKKHQEMGLDSSSGAKHTTNMHSKTSPTQLEGSRGPNSHPKLRGSTEPPWVHYSPPASSKTPYHRG
jgi:hypothetical protein